MSYILSKIKGTIQVETKKRLSGWNSKKLNCGDSGVLRLEKIKGYNKNGDFKGDQGKSKRVCAMKLRSNKENKVNF